MWRWLFNKHPVLEPTCDPSVEWISACVTGDPAHVSQPESWYFGSVRAALQHMWPTDGDSTTPTSSHEAAQIFVDSVIPSAVMISKTFHRIVGMRRRLQQMTRLECYFGSWVTEAT
jgi:hypothetical protein